MHSRMTGCRKLARLAGDQTGQSMVEYALLIAVFGLPMLAVFVKLLELTTEHYGMMVFMQALPFP